MNIAVSIDRVDRKRVELKDEVVKFLHNRLRSERQCLAAQQRHLAEVAGCLHDLTRVQIALLENDINGTERLLQNVH